MNERKKIVNQKDRKSQKLKEALAKKPTASHFNTNGIPPDQIEKLAGQVSVDGSKLFQNRIVRNAKNRKRFLNKPVEVKYLENENSYLDINFDEGESKEWETPEWFRSKEKVDVSVIVPLYKSESVIKDLIASWPLENKCSVEIIFVDDNCPNDSKRTVIKAWEKRKKELNCPIGKIIFNSKNKGYGQACNAGVRFATGKYLIFLNADTKVTPGWIEPMIDLFEDSKVGLVGNMHLKEGGIHDGTIDSAGSEWKWEDKSFVHIGRHCYRRKNLSGPFKIETCPKDILKVSEREMVTGCCFAMPKSIFDYIGGFNPNYRIGYWEDSEICLNVRELGYKILFQPNSIIYHKLGHTSSGGHKYFGHNKKYFMNKWVKSHRLDSLLLEGARSDGDEPVTSILIKRTNAHGDALVATGVCAALKKKYPKAKILFSTLFPEILCQNPNIDTFVEIEKIKETKFDLFYNLDYCYEWRPNVDIMTAYAEAVGVLKKDCSICLRPEPAKINLPENYIIMHAGKTSWVGRDWTHDNFIKIANKLLNQGEKIVTIGNHSEEALPCTLDLRSKTTIPEMAWVMSKAKAFVGIDSLPMHIAQAFNIPGVSFFGCVNPELRIYSKNMQGVTADNLECLGCHHRKAAPSTVTNVCETKTLDCIKLVSVDLMWQKVEKMINDLNQKDC